MKDIFLKDSIDKKNTQIISAQSGKIIEQGSYKYLKLKFGQILDMSKNNMEESKVIKFNSTIFNLTNLKTKSTTFPKLQELDSKILITCMNNFLFGDRQNYTLPTFQCSENSSIKSTKELFNRSIKQFYIILIGLLTALLIFIDVKNIKYSKYRNSIFLLGILCLILSELNSEFLNMSLINNFIMVLLPLMIFTFLYFKIFNMNRRNT